jgi:hypothetical protein
MRKKRFGMNVVVSCLWASSLSVMAIAAARADGTTPHSYQVFFDFNKSTLTEQAVTIVDQAAKDAAEGKTTHIEATGYTDTVGSDAYNLRLSKRRAEAVQAELVKQGIPADEISIIGKGKHDLLVPTKDGVKEPQNRRVSITYDTPTAAAPAPAAAAPEAAAPAAATSAAMTTPAMSASIAANANPMSLDLGSFLGKTYVTGVVSGLGMWQDTVFPGDRSTQLDLSNGQVFIQKTDGFLQYFIQAGAYTVPNLGAPYLPVSKAASTLFGNLPVAYVKLAPSDTFSVEVGKLPTLVGAEYTFTFQNLNIERGLLWNQEPAISRGIQANYTIGPVALSLSWNDGLYSNVFNWISGLATWTIDPSNTLAVDFATNLGHTTKNTFATPLAQNNESIFNVMYTYTSGPWTLSPYFQYSVVDTNASLGFTQKADSYGFALLANYAFDSSGSLAGFSLPARVEYISTSGNLNAGAPSLLYGPGSDAWSFTITPTYQYNSFFARGEFSFVTASGTTPGFALGPNFDSTSQTRLLLETGIVF